MITKCNLRAIATLIGCTIGAGILGIPYVVSKSGFTLGLISIIFIGLVVLVINLYMGEITLRTKENHQLPGYAEKYLGKKGKKTLFFTMLFGSYGGLIAYIVGSGIALSNILLFIGPFYSSLIYFAFMSLLIYFGLRVVEDSEVVLGLIMVSIATIIITFSIASSFFSFSNLAYYEISKFILPYGVILFAFLGAVSVPAMKEILERERKNLKKSIVAGTLGSMAIYAIFSLAVIGVSGRNTTDVATVGLGNILGPNIILFGNLFALFTMSTSFLVIGLAMKEMYYYDFGINKNISWILACFIPLVLFLLGINNFIAIIAVVGAIAGGIQSIVIILMHRNAKKMGNKNPEYSFKSFLPLNIILIGLFIVGIIVEILKTFGIIKFN